MHLVNTTGMVSPPVAGGLHSLPFCLTAVGVAVGVWPTPRVGCLGTGGGGHMQSALTETTSVRKVAAVMVMR